ncbi:DUF3558 domain-containing protein [Nocardia sp. NPDC048505]|uniref:DUF3558 domain-containing protein n=1 Tax=unclassified Nocardia TaxID=2637762 RepID=UPI0033ED0BCA
MRVVAFAVGVCAALALTGCTGTSGSGGPETQPPTSAKLSKDQLWDPCSLPDAVITGAGVDPSSKNPDPVLGDRKDWRLCRWTGKDAQGRLTHALLVSSTSNSLDDFRRNTYFHDFSDVRTGGRAALQFRIGSLNNECEQAFDTSRGVVSVNYKKVIDSASTADPCELARQSAEKIADSLPR